MFQWPTKVSSKKHTLNCFVCLFIYFDLFFVKSLPWRLDIHGHGSKIYFYRNIVRENVCCDMGLMTYLRIYFNYEDNTVHFLVPNDYLITWMSTI